jgi:hypothetical protein
LASVFVGVLPAKTLPATVDALLLDWLFAIFDSLFDAAPYTRAGGLWSPPQPISAV